MNSKLSISFEAIKCSVHVLTCRQSGEFALEQHSVFLSIWSMHANIVSSSLCLQKLFKSAVVAEIAQPEKSKTSSFSKQLVKSYVCDNKPCWQIGETAWEQHDRPIQCEPRSIESSVLFMHDQKSVWISGQNFLRLWSRFSLIDIEVANCTSDNWKR